jgi:hypothetical protein
MSVYQDLFLEFLNKSMPYRSKRVLITVVFGLMLSK